MNQLVQNKFCNVSKLINPSLRKRLGFTPQERGQNQPPAETRWQMILEHFPPKWTPVRRRKCDKRIESGAHPCSVRSKSIQRDRKMRSSAVDLKFLSDRAARSV